MCRKRVRLIPVAILAVGLSGAGASLAFGPDDPVAVATETKDASAVQPREVGHTRDAWQAIRGIGDRSRRKALDVNTVDEVPDSSWFANRIGARVMSAAEIAAGPNGPAPAGPWTVTAAKTEGVTPGLQMKDASGQRYFIKFDPPGYPELGSGAEIISTKLLHAAGYHVPENFIVVFGRGDLRIAPGAMTHEAGGKKREMTDSDLTSLLGKVARRSDGRYRVIASKALPGKPLGPFAYFGVRPDDPNDTIPHEHRRTLRGLRVFAAWINHVDVKSENTLDTLLGTVDGGAVVRHHLIDFNATLGSAGIGPADRRSGHEYIVDRGPILASLFSLGLYVRPWQTIRYPDLPSVGRFESERFEPERWKPTFPNRVMSNARSDDLFWAARRVQAFSDEAIRAVVATADYSDPRAADAIAQALIERRDKIGRQWLTSINPLVDFALDDSRLTFENAAVLAGLAAPASAYRVQWFRFDNASGSTAAIGPVVTATHPAVPLPEALGGADFVAADVSAIHPDHPAWQQPVRVFLRMRQNGWALVGLQRMPEVPM